ncbi:MAG TPA: glycosyltransferase family 39 protein [Candidatus Binatia bacterium]|nr:glycosyltransferase family 39 protein [Candidatus Binatia bacterium]
MSSLTSAPLPVGASAATDERVAGFRSSTVGERAPEVKSPLFPLLTLWLACAFLRFCAAMFVASPTIFGDELIYWSMARSFHHGLHFLAFNGVFDLPTQIYPVLLSPLFAANDSIVTYPLVKLASSLMFCSVVLPAYFLARELLTREESLMVALLSLLIPGGAYSATVMAENIYYPAFVLGVWLAYRALYRGTAGDAVLAGIGFVVGYYAKPHILFMMVAYGMVVLAWFFVASAQGPSLKAGLRQALPGLLRRCIPFAVFACGLGIRLVETGYSHSPTVILFGIYTGILLGKESVPVSAFLVSGAWLLVVMMISTAWLPVPGMIAAVLRWKRLSDAERWFWIFASCTAAVFLVMITRHNVLNDDALRSHERYVFQLSPLFFTGYFAWRRLLPWRWLTPVAAVVVAAVSFLVARSSHLLTWMNFADSPTLSSVFVQQVRHHRHAGAAIFAWLFAGGLLCLAASRAGRKPRRLLIGWGVFLLALNAGWYDLQISFIQREVKHCNDVAMYLKAAVPQTEAVGWLQDSSDVRYGWYSNFWLPQPFYYYSWKEHKYWFERPVTAAPDGGLEFGNPRPQLLLAADSIALPYAVVHDFSGLHLRLYRVPPLAETR